MNKSLKIVVSGKYSITINCISSNKKRWNFWTNLFFYKHIIINKYFFLFYNFWSFIFIRSLVSILWNLLFQKQVFVFATTNSFQIMVFNKDNTLTLTLNYFTTALTLSHHCHVDNFFFFSNLWPTLVLFHRFYNDNCLND